MYLAKEMKSWKGMIQMVLVGSEIKSEERNWALPDTAMNSPWLIDPHGPRAPHPALYGSA
uniref:Uncharacterized protein n=1 Tax=Utricularia reniformis TaxID=192314 RepID=A0A1Y0B3C0_9LAMI|nr:hypothetical protein AEK19_MT1772 [Utricularia reniformis]ART31946.1 hypothetical protein AEK19_MT1772 [Utricularia reniformis]